MICNFDRILVASKSTQCPLATLDDLDNLAIAATTLLRELAVSHDLPEVFERLDIADVISLIAATTPNRQYVRQLTRAYGATAAKVESVMAYVDDDADDNDGSDNDDDDSI